ncbi:hypothetical protein MRX96_042495 [Rhipicephalus microplus]
MARGEHMLSQNLELPEAAQKENDRETWLLLELHHVYALSLKNSRRLVTVRSSSHHIIATFARGGTDAFELRTLSVVSTRCSSELSHDMPYSKAAIT